MYQYFRREVTYLCSVDVAQNYYHHFCDENQQKDDHKLEDRNKVYVHSQEYTQYNALLFWLLVHSLQVRDKGRQAV